MHEGAVEFEQALFENFKRGDVEVVGRLIQEKNGSARIAKESSRKIRLTPPLLETLGLCPAGAQRNLPAQERLDPPIINRLISRSR
jgi:hypothetical protein